MKRLFCLITLSLAGAFICANALADVIPNSQAVTAKVNTEHVVWNKVPISFVVPVGQERMLSFPGVVVLHNVDSALTSDKVSMLNDAGTLYIRAKKTFSPIRIAIEVKQTGTVVLVDLSSAPNADDSPVNVIMAGDNQEVKDSGDNQTPSSAPMNYPRLIRYAIQHLYSPMRLIEDDGAINRTPMYTTKSVNLIYRDRAIAMPLMSWRGGDLYVTAVLIKNIHKYRIHLSPNNVIGKWEAVSYYPTNYVTAAGTIHDRTTMFLVSDRPFNEALNSMREYR